MCRSCGVAGDGTLALQWVTRAVVPASVTITTAVCKKVVRYIPIVRRFYTGLYVVFIRLLNSVKALVLPILHKPYYYDYYIYKTIGDPGMNPIRFRGSVYVSLKNSAFILLSGKSRNYTGGLAV